MERPKKITAGISVRVKRITPFENLMPSPTALHESKHLVMLVLNGGGAKSGTIEPGEGYNGMVEPEEWNTNTAIAAIAPHADGDEGGEFDCEQVIRRGHNIKALSEIARKQLAGLRREVHLVAGLLHSERTVTGTRVKEFLRKHTEDPDEELEVTDSESGKVTSILTTRSKRESIVHDLAA